MTAEMDRRKLLRMGLLTAGGTVLAGGSGLLLPETAEAGTGYNMLAGATSQGDDSNFSDAPALVTYAATGVRGGLWVHDSAVGSVENGSYSAPFHRGDYGHNVRRVRVRSRRSFSQPMSVVVTGRTHPPHRRWCRPGRVQRRHVRQQSDRHVPGRRRRTDDTPQRLAGLTVPPGSG
jgi:hypothetical protein